MVKGWSTLQVKVKVKDKDKDMVKIKEAEIGFNYGILGTVDGLCHVGIYPFSDEGGDWGLEGKGCRVSQFRVHLTN